jgi:hypothetical protein
MTSRYFFDLKVSFTSIDDYDPEYVRLELGKLVSEFILNKYTNINTLDYNIRRIKFKNSSKEDIKQQEDEEKND